MTHLRVISTLPAELEALIYRTVGACIEVHRALGPGWRESAYSKAVRLELATSRVPFVRERTVDVCYKGTVVGRQRIDLVVDEQLVVEIKAVQELHPIHVGQLTNYIGVLKLRAGLLVNFNVSILKDGIRRVVL